MLDRFLDFILQFFNKLIPVAVINQYQNGIRLRFGIYKESLGPGLVWKIPFVDQIMVDHVVETTLVLPTQSLTTADGKPVVVKGMIKYKVDNIANYMLNVYDAKDALSDISCSVIKTIITEKTWQACSDNELDNTITKKTRTRLRNYGIEIIQMTLIDLSNTRSLRLFNEQVMHLNDSLNT